MKGNKIDRRIKYTQMIIKESFIQLLNENHISKITVTQLCEYADINRSTFYTHYDDLYDLLTKMEDEIIEDMIQYLTKYTFNKKQSLEITEKLVEYIASKQKICETLLSENSNSTFENKIREVAHRFLMNDLTQIQITDNKIFEYISAFIISGSIQVIKIWLANGMDQSPREIAHLIIDLIEGGIY